MDEIIQIFTAIDLKYTLSTCLLSYLIIELLQSTLNSKIAKKTNRTAFKRLITVISGIIIAVLYYQFKLLSLDVIIPSFLLSIVLYDYLIKILIRKIKGNNNEKPSSSGKLPDK